MTTIGDVIHSTFACNNAITHDTVVGVSASAPPLHIVAPEGMKIPAATINGGPPLTVQKPAGVIYVAINTALETNAPFLLSQHKWKYSKYFRTYADQNLITLLPAACVDVPECREFRWRCANSNDVVSNGSAIAYYMVVVPADIVDALPPYRGNGNNCGAISSSYVKSFSDLLAVMRAYMTLGEHAELKDVIVKFCGDVINRNTPMWAMLADKPPYGHIFHKRTFDLEDIHGLAPLDREKVEQTKAKMAADSRIHENVYDTMFGRDDCRSDGGNFHFCDDSRVVDNGAAVNGNCSTVINPDRAINPARRIPYKYTPVSPDDLTTSRDTIAQIVALLKSFCARYLDKKGSRAVYDALFMRVYTAISMEFTTLHLLMIREVQQEIWGIVGPERANIIGALISDNSGNRSSVCDTLTNITSHAKLYNMVTKNALHVLYLEECLSQNRATTSSRWCFARDDVAAWYTSSTDYVAYTPYFVTNITRAHLLVNCNVTKLHNVMTRIVLSTEAVNELCKLFSNNLLGETFPWANCSITGSFLMAASSFNGAAFKAIMYQSNMDMVDWVGQNSSTISTSDGSCSSSSSSSSTLLTPSASPLVLTPPQRYMLRYKVQATKNDLLQIKINILATTIHSSIYADSNLEQMLSIAAGRIFGIASKWAYSNMYGIDCDTTNPSIFGIYVGSNTPIDLFTEKDCTFKSAILAENDCRYANIELPLSIFHSTIHPDYHHSGVQYYYDPVVYDTMPGYLTAMDQIGKIMSNPQNIRYNPNVRNLWMLYYKTLYNTDIDIITDFCTDEEFKVRADRIAEHARTLYNCEFQIESLGSPQSFRWQIRPAVVNGSPPPCPPIDFYRNSFGNIFNYHTQMVRAAHGSALAAHNNNGVNASHMYLSNACSMISGYCFDRRWVKCKSSALAVTAKAAERFYVFVLSDPESDIMREYISENLILGKMIAHGKNGFMHSVQHILRHYLTCDVRKTVQEYHAMVARNSAKLEAALLAKKLQA